MEGFQQPTNLCWEMIENRKEVFFPKDKNLE